MNRPVTAYFRHTQNRPDRKQIKPEWIESTIKFAEVSRIQTDGRIRKWKRIAEFENRWLRVILLEDGETLHNAFFDRGFGGES
ncbi:MAG: hypothetical protein OHK0011_21950 [Turneriella sp.]